MKRYLLDFTREGGREVELCVDIEGEQTDSPTVVDMKGVDKIMFTEYGLCLSRSASEINSILENYQQFINNLKCEDKPYIHKIFEEVEGDQKKYLMQLNLKQYIHLNWKDSVFH